MKRKREPTRQLNIRIDPAILRGLDAHVDGVRFRSRAHLIAVAIMEWLDERKRGEK